MAVITPHSLHAIPRCLLVFFFLGGGGGGGGGVKLRNYHEEIETIPFFAFGEDSLKDQASK